MVRLNPPASEAVVDVPDAQVAEYVAQGWSEVSAERSRKTDGEAAPSQRRAKNTNK